MMRTLWGALSDWYDRNYLATLVITTGAFALQVFHLYWLFTAVILRKLTGESWFVFPEGLTLIYIVADYIEIPALISTSLLYASELRNGVRWKAVFYIFLLNTQWLHIYWITDSMVVNTFDGGASTAWNAALAWLAILVDFLEVPVMAEMMWKVYRERGEIVLRVRERLVNQRV